MVLDGLLWVTFHANPCIVRSLPLTSASQINITPAMSNMVVEISFETWKLWGSWEWCSEHELLGTKYLKKAKRIVVVFWLKVKIADVNYKVKFVIYTKVVSDSLPIISWPVNWKQVQLPHCVFIKTLLEETRIVLMFLQLHQTVRSGPQRGDQFFPHSSLTSNLLEKDNKRTFHVLCWWVS